MAAGPDRSARPQPPASDRPVISCGVVRSTAFWIDPAEDLFAVFVTQLIPSGAFDFCGQLRSLVYAAIAD